MTYRRIDIGEADLRVQRMRERFDTSLEGLTEAQVELGNTIARVMDAHGIDHKVTFAVNGAVVLAHLQFKEDPAPKLYAALLDYGIKGDAAVQHALEALWKIYRNAPSSETMDKFIASLKEPLKEGPECPPPPAAPSSSARRPSGRRPRSG